MYQKDETNEPSDEDDEDEVNANEGNFEENEES